MINSIKNKVILLLVFISGIFSFLFLKERNKRLTDESLEKNKETLNKINQIEEEINLNKKELQSEEQKREQIQKEIEEGKKDVSSEELTNFFNNRKS